MTELVLVNPGAQHGIYGALGDTLTALEPPTWARMIAGYCRDRGHSVAMIDAEAERLLADEVAIRVGSLDARLVTIVASGHQPSASTQQMTHAGEIARALKTADRDRIVLMCGNHPSALPERTLREEAVDYVVDGEGPVTVNACLDALNSSVRVACGDIPGLVWSYFPPRHRDGKPIYRNPLPRLIEDLDRDLHGDVWDMLPMDRYRAHQWQCFGDLSRRQPYASIYTTLGCPWKCRFCMVNVFQHTNRYRRFSAEHIVGQIKRLHEDRGISTIKIADEMFVLNEDHYTAVCDSIIAAGLGDKLNLWSYARVDTVKPDKLALLRRAGFRWLALGIESASKHVRDGAAKRLKTDDIVGVVRAVQSAGINVIGNFMFGLRDDTRETMRATLDLALECLPEFANFYSCMAYPGSALYGEAVENGWTLPPSWAGYSQHNRHSRPLDTEHVSGAEVLRFRDAAFDAFFTDPRYLEMIERKFGSETLEHVRGMVGYRLDRDLLEAAD